VDLGSGQKAYSSWLQFPKQTGAARAALERQRPGRKPRYRGIVCSSASGPAKPKPAVNEVTQILSAIEQGDPRAADELLPLVYDELGRLAAHKHLSYVRVWCLGTPPMPSVADSKDPTERR
jgi:hypothetical protein